jgi:hypothetical protein
VPRGCGACIRGSGGGEEDRGGRALGALTQPQQQKQEGGQHYLAVLLDQRMLGPAGWKESRMSVKEVKKAGRQG